MPGTVVLDSSIIRLPSTCTVRFLVSASGDRTWAVEAGQLVQFIKDAVIQKGRCWTLRELNLSTEAILQFEKTLRRDKAIGDRVTEAELTRRQKQRELQLKVPSFMKTECFGDAITLREKRKKEEFSSGDEPCSTSHASVSSSSITSPPLPSVPTSKRIHTEVNLSTPAVRTQEDFFSSLQLASLEPLIASETGPRAECSCGRMGKYYCKHCLRVLLPEGSFPQIRLPLQLLILKHFGEKNAKSTAVHAKLVAPDSTVILDYPQQCSRQHLLTAGSNTFEEIFIDCNQ